MASGVTEGPNPRVNFKSLKCSCPDSDILIQEHGERVPLVLLTSESAPETASPLHMNCEDVKMAKAYRRISWLSERFLTNSPMERARRQPMIPHCTYGAELNEGEQVLSPYELPGRAGKELEEKLVSLLGAGINFRPRRRMRTDENESMDESPVQGYKPYPHYV